MSGRFVVRLTEIEEAMAVAAAVFQRDKSIRDGRSHKNSVLRTPEEHLAQEIQGKYAEMAFAKMRNVFYLIHLDTFSTYPDIDGCEIRSVDSLDKSLIIRGDDKDERPYVLGVVWKNRVKFVGWMYAGEAKIDQFLRNPHGKRESWFVPICCLRYMKDLP